MLDIINDDSCYRLDICKSIFMIIIVSFHCLINIERLHNNDDFHGTPDENVTTINILVGKREENQFT